MFKLLTIFALITLHNAESARVLGLFPHTGKSHQMVFDPLLRRLAEKGHHVTVVSFFPVKNPPANYTDVSLEGLSVPGVETVDLSWYENPSKILRLLGLEKILVQLFEFQPLADMALDVCSKLVKFQPLAEVLKKEYDVVLVEYFNSDCMLGLAHVYGVKAPFIGLLSSSLMQWSPSRIGVSYNPSYVPILSADYTSKMTFSQRLENTLLNEYYKLWFRYSIQEKEREIIEKQFGKKIPDLQDLGANVTMMLVNVFHSLNGVRPLLPGIVEVGGMHLNQARKPLPTNFYFFRINAMLKVLTVYLAAIAFHNAESARILGLFPHIGKSHQMVYNPLLKRLAERGHHVTVVSFFPVKTPPANYTNVSLEGVALPAVEIKDLSYYENPSKILRLLGLEKIAAQISEFNPIAQMALEVCSKLIKFQRLADALMKEYDVVLVENFNSDCILGLAHVYGVKAPFIALSTCSLMHWSPSRIGVSYNPSYVPTRSAYYTSRMSFAERLENTILNEYYKLWFRYSIQMKERRMIEKHFGMKIPDLQELGANITLMLVNVFHSLNGVRPLLPGLVEVGGMHLDPTRKPLPTNFERFLNESEHGVVLFSFGSLIKTASIPKYKEDIIVKALSKLKQRVIWKYEDSTDEGILQGNILKVRWIPQYELLQHPKVIAFIGHGGLLGMTEAISAGKPMLVVPFFGDQPLNGAQATEIGFGKAISYADLTEQSLYEGLQYVLSAEMRLSARRASQIWHDRQNNPLDTAVFWTERVIRWGHSDPLHSIARDLPLYQYLLLDVVGTVLIVLFVFLFVVKLILGQILRLFSSSINKKEKLH